MILGVIVDRGGIFISINVEEAYEKKVCWIGRSC